MYAWNTAANNCFQLGPVCEPRIGFADEKQLDQERMLERLLAHGAAGRDKGEWYEISALLHN